MIAAIGSISNSSASTADSAEYVARLAELRRQIAAIQRRLAENAKGGASELNMLTQQQLTQQVAVLQAQIAMLQLPYVHIAPPITVNTAQQSKQTQQVAVPQLATQGQHEDRHQQPDSLTYDPTLGGVVDREA
ncbi:MAG: hypothetical protein U0164_19055 [Gemmatimonadaceae bacterium]